MHITWHYILFLLIFMTVVNFRKAVTALTFYSGRKRFLDETEIAFTRNEVNVFDTRRGGLCKVSPDSTLSHTKLTNILRFSTSFFSPLLYTAVCHL